MRGLVSTAPDMKYSLDTYVKDTNFYDFEIVSTLGLVDEDIEKLREIEDVEKVEGIKTKDIIGNIEEKEYIIKAIEYNENINKPYLLEGRLPENENECVVDSLMIKNNIQDIIEKKIQIRTNDEEIDKKELKIVGIVNSSQYISSDRGNTTLSSGKIDGFIYTKNILKSDYYSNIYVIAKGTKETEIESEKYKEIVNKLEDKLDNIKSERENARFEEIKKEATEKINKAKSEFETKKAEGQKELEDAQKQINDGESELLKSEKLINSNQSKLNLKKQEAEKSFILAEQEIQKADNTLKEKGKELDYAKEQFKNNEEQVKTNIEKIDTSINVLNINLKSLEKQKEELQELGQDTKEIDVAILTVKNSIQELENKKTKISKGIEDFKSKISNAEKELSDGNTELNNRKKQLQKTKTQTNLTFKDSQNQINNARQKLKEGKSELENSKKELQDGTITFNTEIQNAQNKINEAEKEVEDIKNSTWYIWDRRDNVGYDNIIQAIDSIANLASMFPIIFYAISILISLTSMTRMIEEERIEIGTLKGLGYSNYKIISKYLIYSASACLIGGILGMTVSFYLIPNVAWSVYKLLYELPNFYAIYRLDIGIIGIVISFICITGATLLVAIKELKNSPSELMRPKAPKKGKRVILERITFIWNKLNFSYKVTIRNLFRYKKRVLMTILGIAGCTALILTGFGIKDSITSVPIKQFENVFKYDMIIALKPDSNIENIEEIARQEEKIKDIVRVHNQTAEIKKDDLRKSATIMIADNKEEFEKVCGLTDVFTKEKVNISDNGIIVSDKLAELINAKQGDNVYVSDKDNIEYEFKIDYIIENYVEHYVFMSKDLFNKEMGEYKTNLLLVEANNIEEQEENEISQKILETEQVISVNNISKTMKTVKDMMSSLNYVVLVLIISSAMLAFVVLYNLSNININERIREIATLKVLGFYDKEVDNYINRESIILTIIGIALGLLLGYFLSDFIITTCEVERLRFTRDISIFSYIYSALITITFTLIVNFLTHKVLKKVDMIQSLKSIE